jgi:hypothetical protein
MISTLQEFDAAALLADDRLQSESYRNSRVGELLAAGLFNARSEAQDALLTLARHQRGETIATELIQFFADQKKFHADAKALRVKQAAAFSRQLKLNEARAAIVKIERRIVEVTEWAGTLDGFTATAAGSFGQIDTLTAALELGRALAGADRAAKLIVDDVLPKLADDLTKAKRALKAFEVTPS